MTELQAVFDAFLGKIEEDEWVLWEETDMQEDLFNLLLAAIPWFKFPRTSLALSEEYPCFEQDLNNDEIQILATYMKCEWLNRTILTWENVKPLYEERDFSQANLLDKFKNQLEFEKKNGAKLESKYYRSINNKPYDYRKLASRP